LFMPEGVVGLLRSRRTKPVAAVAEPAEAVAEEAPAAEALNEKNVPA